jgi:DNA-directed RNA polymerase specialized sigma24 family protein
VENARRKQREKVGGQLQKVAIEELQIGVECPPDDLLHLNELLDELSASDAQIAELVKLHCFAGLSIEQGADLLGTSARTAYRDWAYARAWLFKRLELGDKKPAN